MVGSFDVADPQKSNQVQNGVFKYGTTTERISADGNGNEHANGNGLPNGNGHLCDHNFHLSVHASHVVGCDGANSTVRRVLNFPTTDLNFENDWLIVDLVSTILISTIAGLRAHSDLCGVSAPSRWLPPAPRGEARFRPGL